MRVLVVEDDEGMAMMLRFCFQRAGFDVDSVHSGKAAIRILDEQPPDAVILDLGLSNHRCEVVLRYLLDMEGRGNRPPAWIAMSSLGSDAVERLYGSLEGHFLSKPFDPWELVRSVGKMLSAGVAR